MGVSKSPLRGQALLKLDAAGRSNDFTEWVQRLYLVLRFTGMHSACVYRPEANIRGIDRNGVIHIVWARPMKGAEKGRKNYWKDVAGVPKSRFIDFDIHEWYLQNVQSKRKYPAWKSKIHYNIKEIGIKAGFTDVSPNSLRHSFLMELMEVHKFPKADVCAMAGCSINTLDKHYNTLGPEDRARKLIEAGW